MMEWAAALLAHNLLLRAGELGCVAAGGFEPERCITWASFHWQQPCYESRGCPWFTVDVVAIKDVVFRHRVVPMVVRRQLRVGRCYEQHRDDAGRRRVAQSSIVDRMWPARVREMAAMNVLP